MTRLLTAATIATLALSSAALANGSWMDTQSRGDGYVKTTGGPMPHEGYASRRWTHPIGCQYSRAERPGEIVWYLIRNTARKGCPSYIVQKGFDDVY